MNPQGLLEQFLGPNTMQHNTMQPDTMQNVGQSAGGALQTAKEKVSGSGMGGVAGGLAAGGLLGLMLGNKKMRKKAGKVAGYGGAAALGALAYRAYQNWQTNKQAPAPQPVPQQQPAPVALEVPPADSKFVPANAPATDGKPFELALVTAMIGAANADGHITPDEQRMIFDKVGELPLDAEDKAFVFDMLSSPPGLQDIANLADGPEQAAELYLVSRLAIDPDDPIEQAYLEGLAHRLSIPPELVSHLDQQAAVAAG